MFFQELRPNACDIFKQKIFVRIFLKYKPLTKNHKIKDLAFLSLNLAKKVLVLVDFFLDFRAKKP
jgi:hypothetical protein